MESCEEERSVLRRRLQASFVEVERQVIKTSIESRFDDKARTFIVTFMVPCVLTENEVLPVNEVNT